MRATAVPHGSIDDLAADCARLVALRDRGDELIARNGTLARADLLRHEHMQEWLDLSKELDAACEDARARYFPRRHTLICALGMVVLHSRTGRSSTIVYSRERGLEYVSSPSEATT